MALLKRKQKELDPNAILTAEFEYAAHTAFQSNEDRINLFNYFLGTAATLLAGGIIANLDNPQHRLIIAIVLLGIAFLGFISFLKLIKIRIAWKSSVIAMNQIKDFYIRKFGKIELATAFKWRMDSIPKLGKPWSIGFLMGIVLAVTNSFALSAALYLLSHVLAAGVLLGILSILMHAVCWVFLLRE